MKGAARCTRFVRDVLSGKRAAPKTVIQACKRFKKDLKNKRFFFDTKAADANIAVMERFPHAKGRWQGKSIDLEDWQCFFVGNIYGWIIKKTGLRRFRYAYEQVPRKNGKSLVAICIGLVMLGPDKEKGSEVYLGATTEVHAKDLLLKPAKYIVNTAPDFKQFFGIEVGATAIVIPSDFSSLKAVIRKPDDGYNPHCAIVDEYHQHDTDEQYSTFDTGMGSREQPLLLVTTTAGSSIGGPCHEMRNDCIKVLDGTVEADSLFVLIYEPDKGDEWDSEETLRKVNPNIGVSVSEDYLLDQLQQARRSASKQNAYRTKHLNEWVGSKSVWLNALAWQRQKRKFKIEDFADYPAMACIDLAHTADLAALALVFKVEDKYKAFCRFWAAEETIANNDKYRQFQLNGWLTSTPGETTDFDFIEQAVLDLRDDYELLQVGYDPWQAKQMSQHLDDAGIDVVEYRPTIKTMSEPMKLTERWVLDGTLEHEGNPCLTWCVGNVYCRKDEKENVYPTKEKKDSINKIDGAVVLIQSVGLWIPEQEESYTDSHGVVAL